MKAEKRKMMRKKMLFAAILCLIIVLICGCKTSVSIATSKTENMFSVVYTCSYGTVLVDNDTNVMYWCSRNGYDSRPGVLTPLIDRRGYPKLYHSAGEVK